MKSIRCELLCAMLGIVVMLLPFRVCAATIPVVVPPDASSAERVAAKELTEYLGRIYPHETFKLRQGIPKSGRAVVLGCATNSMIRALLDQPAPSAAESFRVTSRRDQARDLGLVIGADGPGVIYGVYALLQKLGAGFYVSCDALPRPKQPFTFDDWHIADQPLVRDRLVFNWHNFLSGCSTWNLEEWQSWIRQSQKMGYNAVMVHAYGNNPMVSFDFNGKTKPIGYLSTTAKGRDWSTMHVNDVRRLWGGNVFTQPVFGADAAMAPEPQRAAAAQQLMRDVFALAQARAMDVYFADDVDTISANPQELIQTLPPDARFSTGDGKVWLANPETPQGYRYYKAQVQALITAYPQITCLVVWFRTGGTPWMEVKVSEMPIEWQKEYEREIAQTPHVAQLWKAPQMFAIGKIVRAFDRALKELGRGNVQLAAGTWRFDFLAPCDRFFPPQVKLIGLDYNVLHDSPQLADEQSRKGLREIGAHRAIVPVIWAQHDDGNYIGRPYTPFSDFYSRLNDANASGFGVIHWTTRPLDLFFASHSRQVWAGTKNESLRETCSDMATKSFGELPGNSMANYLERWITDAPKFARETGNWFIDRPLTNVAEVVTGCRERLKLIAAVDQSPLATGQRDRINYYKGLEEFIAAFFESHAAFQRAQQLLQSGDIEGARALMAAVHAEKVIEQFASFSSLGGMTRGEQGLVVSLNTRWLPHIVGLRQALGLEAIRLNFAPTSHEPLAQAAGKYTFHFDPERHIWECAGTEETGADTFVLPPATRIIRSSNVSSSFEEICRSGIESDKPLRISLRPMVKAGALPRGHYRLRLLMLDPSSAGSGERVFTVSVAASSLKSKASPMELLSPDTVDVVKETGKPNRVLERSYPIDLAFPGELTLTLTPVKGKIVLCGAILEP